MTTIQLLGAGVVGQVYGGLLARAGHEVTLLARGRRGAQLGRDGVVLMRGGATAAIRVEVVDISRAGRIAGERAVERRADVLIVAVRGDQVDGALESAAGNAARRVVWLGNPVGARETIRRSFGADRVVFAFSGIGGGRRGDGAVVYESVSRQDTTVDTRADVDGEVAALFATTGLPVAREPRMGAWLDSHSVLVAGLAAACLAARGGAAEVARSRRLVGEVVDAMSEAFAAIEACGGIVVPRTNRLIFGRLPRAVSIEYWRRAFAAPMVRVSVEPHARATRLSEMPAVARHALTLVGVGAPRYTALVRRGILDRVWAVGTGSRP